MYTGRISRTIIISTLPTRQLYCVPTPCWCLTTAGVLAMRKWQLLAPGWPNPPTCWRPARSTEKDISPSLGRVLPALFGLKDWPQKAARPPLVRDVFLNEIEVMVARDREGSSQGLYVAAKGGHNAESHNHNDIGNFVDLYRRQTGDHRCRGGDVFSQDLQPAALRDLDDAVGVPFAADDQRGDAGPGRRVCRARGDAPRG